jgi:hypothetical protein
MLTLYLNLTTLFSCACVPHSYREAALLIDAQQSSAGRKQGVARTVSHELAHQCTPHLTLF